MDSDSPISAPHTSINRCRVTWWALPAAIAATLASTPAVAQDGSNTVGTESVTVPGGTSTTVVVQPPTTTPADPAPSVTPWGVFGGTTQEPDTSYDFDSSRTNQSQTIYGSKGGSFVLGDQLSGLTPDYHVVRKGDTLWDLCDHYYSDPYEWPRVWSYNPQIENPHWIYPGERLRITATSDGSSALGRPGQTRSLAGDAGSWLHQQTRTLRPGMLVLRDYGFVGDSSKDVWGSLVGSPNDQMLLSEGDEAYVQINDKRTPKIGQHFSIFRNTRTPEAGEDQEQVVTIKGSVKIIGFNDKTKIARVQITESFDVIERGDQVGPATRPFTVIDVVPNKKEVWAKITGCVQPRELVAQHQIVFIDKGSKDGLQPGNRLFAVGPGNRWEQSLKGAGRMASSQVQYELKSFDIERTPEGPDKLPTQVVGEVRVIRVQNNTAVCLVTRSQYELEPGQALLARKGY